MQSSDTTDINTVARDHEHEQWSELFRRELEGTDAELYSSYWWKVYYDQMMQVIAPLLAGDSPKVLEAGSGSGKGSILLGKAVDRTLLDISHDALEYAKLLAKKFGATNISFVEGDIFASPFKTRSFDLVWNIGVVEHYEQPDATKLLENMIRVTKPGGHVVIGVPNFRSPPIIKAKLLNRRLFRFIPGYRLDSELDYSFAMLNVLASKAARNCKRVLSGVCEETIGVPLFVESPKIIVNTIGKMTNVLMPDRKFLKLLVIRVQ